MTLSLSLFASLTLVRMLLSVVSLFFSEMNSLNIFATSSLRNECKLNNSNHRFVSFEFLLEHKNCWWWLRSNNDRCDIIRSFIFISVNWLHINIASKFFFIYLRRTKKKCVILRRASEEELILDLALCATLCWKVLNFTMQIFFLNNFLKSSFKKKRAKQSAILREVLSRDTTELMKTKQFLNDFRW